MEKSNWFHGKPDWDVFFVLTRCCIKKDFKKINWVFHCLIFVGVRVKDQMKRGVPNGPNLLPRLVCITLGTGAPAILSRTQYTII